MSLSFKLFPAKVVMKRNNSKIDTANLNNILKKPKVGEEPKEPEEPDLIDLDLNQFVVKIPPKSKYTDMEMHHLLLQNNPHHTAKLDIFLPNPDVLKDSNNYYPLRNPIRYARDVKIGNTQLIRQKENGKFTEAMTKLRNGEIECYPKPKIGASFLATALGLFHKDASEKFGRKYYKPEIEKFKSYYNRDIPVDMSSIEYLTEWGTLHEDLGIEAIIKCFKNQKSKIELYEVGTFVYNIYSKLDLNASPDALFILTDEMGRKIDGVVEIKCRSPWVKNQYKRNYTYSEIEPYDTPPLYYYPQMWAQALAAGKSWILFCSVTPVNGSWIFLIKFHLPYAELFLELVKFVNEKYKIGKAEIDTEYVYKDILEKRLLFLHETLKLKSRIVAKWRVK